MALLPQPLRDPWNGGPYPLAINVNAKILGLVVAILSALGLLVSIFALPLLLGVSALTVGLGYHGFFIAGIIGLLAGIAAEIASVIGGFQMYQGRESGKDLVLLGLVINFIADLIYGVGYVGIGGQILPLVVIAIIWYLVVVSRWPDQAPVGGGSSAPPPPPPPGYSDYTPPPPPAEPPAGGDS